MKTLILAIFASLFFVASYAQKTVPRYGTAANQNNTYSGQKLGYVKFTDAALQDTLVVQHNSFRTHVDLTVTDTVCVYVSPKTAYAGDQLVVTVLNTSGANHFVKFTSYRLNQSPYTVGTGTNTLTLTSGNKAIINFIFIGGSWTETGRQVF